MTRLVDTLTFLWWLMFCVASEMPETLMFPKAGDMIAGQYEFA